uniref:Uncharacterized protein n=1 Tax=Rhizophora mucronata TaxID=61149 RepID=A0A2P2NF92_RHIMU
MQFKVFFPCFKLTYPSSFNGKNTWTGTFDCEKFFDCRSEVSQSMEKRKKLKNKKQKKV